MRAGSTRSTARGEMASNASTRGKGRVLRSRGLDVDGCSLLLLKLRILFEARASFALLTGSRVSNTRIPPRAIRCSDQLFSGWKRAATGTRSRLARGRRIRVASVALSFSLCLSTIFVATGVAQRPFGGGFQSAPFAKTLLGTRRRFGNRAGIRIAQFGFGPGAGHTLSRRQRRAAEQIL